MILLKSIPPVLPKFILGHICVHQLSEPQMNADNRRYLFGEAIREDDPLEVDPARFAKVHLGSYLRSSAFICGSTSPQRACSTTIV